MRKRIGPKEQLVLNSVLKIARGYQIFMQHKKKGETYFNDQLINVLRQSVEVENREIHTARLFGEIFRPECYVKGAGDIPLVAFECKKLSDQFAKARWKEGISQAILYSRHWINKILMKHSFASH